MCYQVFKIFLKDWMNIHHSWEEVKKTTLTGVWKKLILFVMDEGRTKMVVKIEIELELEIKLKDKLYPHPQPPTHKMPYFTLNLQRCPTDENSRYPGSEAENSGIFLQLEELAICTTRNPADTSIHTPQQLTCKHGPLYSFTSYLRIDVSQAADTLQILGFLQQAAYDTSKYHYTDSPLGTQQIRWKSNLEATELNK